MTWWQRLRRSRQMETQLEREVQFHLDQHISDLVARGLDPEQARRQARLALGGPEQVKEECRDARGTRWLEDLGRDLRYALRTLRRRPGFAAVAVCTLALGIGATTLMFTVIHGVLLSPLAYPEPDRLLALHAHTPGFGEFWGFSYPDFEDVRRDSRTLDVAAWTYSSGMVTEPGEAGHADGRLVSANLFPVLGVTLAAGRSFLPEEDRRGAAPVAIISYALWQRRFAGRAEAVGQSLVFDGKAYTVIGITPAAFQLAESFAFTGGVDVYTPLGQATEPRMQTRAARFLHAVGRLRPQMSSDQARTEVALLARHLAEEYPQSNAALDMLTMPLRRELVGNVRPTLWLLLGAVTLVLLIACVNVASLQLARAISRERELVMRVALGAGRGRLVRQSLTESAVLGLAGGTLGILIATLGLHPFVVLWPGGLPRAADIRLDASVLGFTLVLSLGCGILFGLAPALRVPVRELEQTLRAGARTVTGGSRRAHSVFVGAQLALAVVLLVTAGILGRTLLRLASLNPGIDAHNVLASRVELNPVAFDNPVQTRAAWQDVLDRARRVPGVESVALVDIVPMRVGQNVVGYWATPDPPPPDQVRFALASSASPDYLKVMHIRLRRGRFFNDHDRPGSGPVVVIDENLAHDAFGSADPVGRRLWVQGLGAAPVEIIGVVGHVRHWGLADDDQSRIRAQVYYPFAQVPDVLMHFFSTVMSVTVRTSAPPEQVADALRRELREAGHGAALYETFTMEQLVRASLDRQRFLMVLFGLFAGLALVLACLGLYGVLAYLMSQRVPEVGVRMALGASAGSVIGLVIRQSLPMILSGIVIGVTASFATGRLLERLVAGVRSADPFTYAAMVSVLLVAALFATFLPARRASRIDPTVALRQE